MTKLTRRQIAAFARFTVAELKEQFDAIGTKPEHRVKSGLTRGCIKIKAAQYGDLILAEISRRREEQNQ